jgi:dihydrofolate reductase
MADFAHIWQAADRIVFSKTLQRTSTGRTRIERDFDPEAVRRIKTSAGSDLTVGGPHLAAQAFKAGLVDECHLFITPIVVGAVSRRSQTTSGWSSDCWTNAASAAAWSICATE